jgi:RNA polymerase sigma factor (sigma-70 family)
VSVIPAPRPTMSPPRTRPAFADVAERNLDGVHRYLTHLTGNRDLAEDLTSATFERALRDWPRYDPTRATPTVWLIEVARRVALDHFRKDGRRRAREERYAAGEPDTVPGPDAPRGFSTDIRAALGRLTRGERELVALRVVLGLDAADAGRIAGMSPTAVGTSLHRALTKLRQEVERP